MRPRFNMKTGLVYLFLLTYIILMLPYFHLFDGAIGGMFLKPLYWFIIFGYMIIVIGPRKPRIRKEKDKLQIIAIFLILYFMLYFFTGLLFGYQRSPYSHALMPFLLNLWMFIPIVIMQEYTRMVLVQNARKQMFWYITIVILFTLVDINISTILDEFVTLEDAFKFTCSTILPSLFQSILLVFLAKTSGFKALLLYQVSFELLYLILPIFPDLDWFFSGILQMILPVVLFFNVNYIEMHDLRLFSRKDIKKQSPLRLVPTLIVVFLLVGFVAGFFRYQPVAIMSNSMIPEFQRGDAVIVKKISEKEKKKLKKGVIIRYQTSDRDVVHRISRIVKDKNGQVAYITKGDNNNAEDVGIVTTEQIYGIVEFYVPKIGYPSVWMYELFQKNK